MCGRICVASMEDEIEKFFSIDGQLPGFHPMPPRYNIAPTQPILTILGNHEERLAKLMKWAFLPSWVKDPTKFSQIINARVETVKEKPSFKNAIRHRRCLIPGSGFYEWQRDKAEGSKQPYWIAPRQDTIMALAGIWESWMGPYGEEVDTVAILTCPANQKMSRVHHRMPVIVTRESFGTWLDTSSGRTDEIEPLLLPAPEDFLDIHPVSDRVNRTINDDAELIKPVKLTEKETSGQASQKSQKSDSENDPEASNESDSDQLSLF